jgi:hypothetical protein
MLAVILAVSAAEFRYYARSSDTPNEVLSVATIAETVPIRIGCNPVQKYSLNPGESADCSLSGSA